MATLRTVARRVSLAALALLSVAVIALVVYTRSESFQRRLEARALAEINGAIRGTVSWERFDGSLWSGLRIRNLQLSYGGHEIFKAQLAEVDYALLPLFWKKVQITRLAATQPVLDLRKLPDGEWNLVQALSSRERSSGEFDWVVAIDAVNIADGDLLLRPMANKPELYRLRKLEIGGRVRIAEGLNVDVERLASWVDAPQAPQLYVSGELGYRQTGETQTLRFNKFWLQTHQAQ